MRSQLPEETFFDPAQIPAGAQVLDLGCGEVKRVPWAVGLDRVATAAADVVHDWPFPDDHFDVVLASHVVEHVDDLVRLCQELHRVCRHGAQVRIATPHFTSPDAHADPTHRHALAYRSFEFFARPEHAQPPRLQALANRLFGLQASVAGWYAEPLFEIVERRITFRRVHRLLGVDRLARQVPLLYEYFLAGFAPARDLQVVLRVLKSSQ